MYKIIITHPTECEEEVSTTVLNCESLTDVFTRLNDSGYMEISMFISEDAKTIDVKHDNETIMTFINKDAHHVEH